jgi:hypothetical protein
MQTGGHLTASFLPLPILGLFSFFPSPQATFFDSPE